MNIKIKKSYWTEIYSYHAIRSSQIMSCVRLMMAAETGSKTLKTNSILKWLIFQEDFIALSCGENLNSYIIQLSCSCLFWFKKIFCTLFPDWSCSEVIRFSTTKWIENESGGIPKKGKKNLHTYFVTRGCQKVISQSIYPRSNSLNP